MNLELDQDENEDDVFNRVLGELDETQGCTLFEEGTVVTLPLICVPGIILFPEQILPLRLKMTNIINQIKSCLENERVFAFVPIRQEYPQTHNSSALRNVLAPVGTTAQIIGFSEERIEGERDRNFIAGRSNYLGIKSKGQQRFKLIKSWVNLDNTLSAQIQILPDICDIEPLYYVRPISWSKLALNIDPKTPSLSLKNKKRKISLQNLLDTTTDLSKKPNTLSHLSGSNKDTTVEKSPNSAALVESLEIKYAGSAAIHSPQNVCVEDSSSKKSKILSQSPIINLNVKNIRSIVDSAVDFCAPDVYRPNLNTVAESNNDILSLKQQGGTGVINSQDHNIVIRSDDTIVEKSSSDESSDDNFLTPSASISNLKNINKADDRVDRNSNEVDLVAASAVEEEVHEDQNIDYDNIQRIETEDDDEIMPNNNLDDNISPPLRSITSGDTNGAAWATLIRTFYEEEGGVGGARASNTGDQTNRREYGYENDDMVVNGEQDNLENDQDRDSEVFEDPQRDTILEVRRRWLYNRLWSFLRRRARDRINSTIESGIGQNNLTRHISTDAYDVSSPPIHRFNEDESIQNNNESMGERRSSDPTVGIIGTNPSLNHQTLSEAPRNPTEDDIMDAEETLGNQLRHILSARSGRRRRTGRGLRRVSDEISNFLNLLSSGIFESGPNLNNNNITSAIPTNQDHHQRLYNRRINSNLRIHRNSRILYGNRERDLINRPHHLRSGGLQPTTGLLQGKREARKGPTEGGKLLSDSETYFLKRLNFVEQKNIALSRLNSVTSYLTHWPAFVYKQYDLNCLVDLLLKEIFFKWKGLAKTAYNIPNDPFRLFCWINKCVPIDYEPCLRLLTIDNIVTRLRAQLNILKQCKYFACKYCMTLLFTKRDVFNPPNRQAKSTFVNPSDKAYEFVTVNRMRNIRLDGDWSNDFTWFTGYSWSVLHCRECHNFLGWSFHSDAKLNSGHDLLNNNNNRPDDSPLYHRTRRNISSLLFGTNLSSNGSRSESFRNLRDTRSILDRIPLFLRRNYPITYETAAIANTPSPRVTTSTTLSSTAFTNDQRKRGDAENPPTAVVQENIANFPSPSSSSNDTKQKKIFENNSTNILQNPNFVPKDKRPAPPDLFYAIIRTSMITVNYNNNKRKERNRPSGNGNELGQRPISTSRLTSILPISTTEELYDLRMRNHPDQESSATSSFSDVDDDEASQEVASNFSSETTTSVLNNNNASAAPLSYSVSSSDDGSADDLENMARLDEEFGGYGGEGNPTDLSFLPPPPSSPIRPRIVPPSRIPHDQIISNEIRNIIDVEDNEDGANPAITILPELSSGSSHTDIRDLLNDGKNDVGTRNSDETGDEATSTAAAIDMPGEDK